MFTGIVQELLHVHEIDHGADLSRLTLKMGALGYGLQLGASVAINGTCLTVTQHDLKEFSKKPWIRQRPV